MKKQEKVILLPLSIETYNILEKESDKNRRSIRRQAQLIIEDYYQKLYEDYDNQIEIND